MQVPPQVVPQHLMSQSLLRTQPPGHAGGMPPSGLGGMPPQQGQAGPPQPGGPGAGPGGVPPVAGGGPGMPLGLGMPPSAGGPSLAGGPLGSGFSPRDWHTDVDVRQQRTIVAQNIVRIFQQRRPQLQSQWSDKFPDFIKRLEEGLFRQARTKEEYCDTVTLERRLFEVARTILSQPQPHGGGGQQRAAAGPAPQQPQQQGQGPSPQAQAGHQQSGAAPLQQQGGGGAPPQTSSQQQLQQAQAPPQAPRQASPQVAPQGAGPQGAHAGASVFPTPAANYGVGPTNGMPHDYMGGLQPAGQRLDPHAAAHHPHPHSQHPAQLYAGNHHPMHSASLHQVGPMGGLPARPGAGMSLPGYSGAYRQDPRMLGMRPSQPGAGVGHNHSGELSISPPSMMPQLMNGERPPSSYGSMGSAQHHLQANGLYGDGAPPPTSAVMANGAPVLLRKHLQQNDWPPVGSLPLMQNESGGLPGALPNGLNPNASGLQQPPMGSMNHMLRPQPGGLFPQPKPTSNMVPVNNLQQFPPNMIPVTPSPMPSTALQQQQQGLKRTGTPNMMIPVGPGPTMSGGMSGSMGMGNGTYQATSAQMGVPQQLVQNRERIANVLDPLNEPRQPVPLQQQQGPPQHNQQAMQNRQEYILKQQRWLLFLRHCAKCQQSEEECQFHQNCRIGKELWQHILNCSNPTCTYNRCVSSKDLLKHHQKCQNPQCPICTPVKDYVKRFRPGTGSQQTQLPGPRAAPQQAVSANMMNVKANMSPTLQTDVNSILHAPNVSTSDGVDLHNIRKSLQMQPSLGPKRTRSPIAGVPPGSIDDTASVLTSNLPKEEEGPDMKRVKTENGHYVAKNTGTSLVETFTREQIVSHVEQIKSSCASARNNQVAHNPEDECDVCGITRLTFEPPCLYCSQCGQRIKRGQVYYTTPPEQEIRACWCHTCYVDNRGEKIVFEGLPLRKADLHKKRNDEEIEEGWVQCDACEKWVHQICGLFNKGRNDKSVHYLCPKCLLLGLDTGKRRRTEVRPQSMLEGKDLPHNALSRFLEARLLSSLAKERAARAAAVGKRPEEVPTAEGLTVRVVNNVVKKCEVKPKFAESFRGDGYPSEFPYRQKVILLFQNIDGVDVNLYCMYVQEYGADCPAPNRNCVYLSYIDSIKYFRPEVQAAGSPNLSLRTFVYHQILLGYLDNIHKRGFEQMYIWACPPLQGDDYILYCHPARQKTPRSDRLRAWYLDMLRKAREEGTVTHVTTLWDTYFEGGRDHRYERCSAAAIPYLEGDYWPGEAEHLLTNMSELAARGAGKKGSKASGGSAASRKATAKGKRYGGGAATTDEQLMSKLSDILGGNMKDDFIVVHLREACTFCRRCVKDGSVYRYVPPAGVNPYPLKPPTERKFEGIKLEHPMVHTSAPTTHFQMCQSCFTEEFDRVAVGQKSRLPQGLALNDLQKAKIEPQSPIKDTDPELESEFYETRQAFLSLCQGNHYQFDTLRRAKHSSMMVLYHLHNPSAPAFACTCNMCNSEIEPGGGYRCTVCQDFDMCAMCRQRGVQHEHPLTAHVNYHKMDETRQRLTEQERKERSLQLQRTMALLVHACDCKNPNCSSSSCRKVRQLFQHAVQCQMKVTGGCQLCKKMWCLLNLHAKSCTNANCSVPRCKELKELRRRQTARTEAKRRKAYMNMLRKQNQPSSGKPSGPDQ